MISASLDDAIDGPMDLGKETILYPDTPGPVKSAASLALFLALYALVMSVPITCTGSFVGLQILIPGVLHAVLGTLLLFARNGLLRRKCWARWLLIGLAALVEVTLLIATVQGSMSGEIDVAAIIWISVLSLNFALIPWFLSTKSACVWFAK